MPSEGFPNLLLCCYPKCRPALHFTAPDGPAEDSKLVWQLSSRLPTSGPLDVSANTTGIFPSWETVGMLSF